MLYQKLLHKQGGYISELIDYAWNFIVIISKPWLVMNLIFTFSYVRRPIYVYRLNVHQLLHTIKDINKLYIISIYL